MKNTITDIFRFTRKPALAVFAMTALLSCDDFIEIDPPRTDLTRSAVFSSDVTANAAMLDIYYSMHQQGFASGDARSLSYLGSISADEQIDYTTGGSALITQPFYDHTLTPTDQEIQNSWSRLYSWIYKSNSILEGLESSTSISEPTKKRLEGEAKFIRAFSHFYLVNLWGPVPLVLTTDYEQNSNTSRQAEDEVYQQIIQDLKDAQELLSDDYAASGNERTRPNKWAATALLARTYLYIKDWSNAELEATRIIDNSGMYSLQSDLKKVFTKNNEEAIWQFICTSINLPKDHVTFYMLGTTPSNGALREGLVNSFPAGDMRRTDWIGNVTGPGGEVYYFSAKYSSSKPLEEYSTVLRLAEQYLIRAEARAWQDRIAEAQQDLNAVRNRADAGNTDATDKTSLILAINSERQFEFFTEWGHRWLDLKRTGTINEVLTPLKPAWRPEAALFPIPESQVLNSPVDQNPGY